MTHQQTSQLQMNLCSSPQEYNFHMLTSCQLPACSLSEVYGAGLEKEVVCLIDSKVKMTVIERMCIL